MPDRIQIKICGITSPEDAHMAVLAGADAIGVVFARQSPRYVNARRAAEIFNVLPPFMSTVGLFMDSPPTEVETFLQQSSVHILQFHGAESAAECARYGRPYIKTAAVADADVLLALQRMREDYPDAESFLLDGHLPGEQGGRGHSFNWVPLPTSFRRQVILAGGLRPDNVQRALQISGVSAVDVCSGVEESPGRKSHRKMDAFIQAVRAFTHGPQSDA